VINTNVEAIKNSQGRRWFILDVSTKRMQDFNYFSNLKKNCFNNEVGEAFYNYLLSIDTSNFSSQHDMPESQNKLDIIAQNLDLEYKFLKKEVILKEKNICCSVNELYKNFQVFCAYSDLRITKIPSKHNFTKKLRDIDIESYKSNDVNKYKLNYLVLKDYFETRKWIHILDYDDVEDSEDESLDEIQLHDNTLSPEFKADFKTLKEENDTLKKQNQLFQQRVDKLLASLTMLEKMQQNIDETHTPCNFKYSHHAHLTHTTHTPHTPHTHNTYTTHNTHNTH